MYLVRSTARIYITRHVEIKHENHMSRCYRPSISWYPPMDTTYMLSIVYIVMILIDHIRKISESQALTTTWAYRRLWLFWWPPRLWDYSFTDFGVRATHFGGIAFGTIPWCTTSFSVGFSEFCGISLLTFLRITVCTHFHHPFQQAT
jgi:hypothetical protein